VLPVGSFLGDATSGAGLLAAAIAICGFLGQAAPALRRRDDRTVRALTVIGGLVGLAIGLGVLAIGVIVR
jgi:hypothetical protein